MSHDPVFEKVLLSESSFLIKEEHFTLFEIPWHVQSEFEFPHLVQAKGKINAADAGGIPFPEGAGVYGYLSFLSFKDT